jgi:dCTP deaminase
MMIPDVGIREMVWPSNGAQAAVWIPEHYATFGPITEDQIQPASLDVRLAPDFIRHPSGERVTVRPGCTYSLAGGECILGSLIEALDMNTSNVAARIEGKSTWARQFLTVHSAGFIDPGFRGAVTLELKNDGHSRLELRPGVAIAQISFHFLAAPAERLYGGVGLNSHYQNQTGTTEART